MRYTTPLLLLLLFIKYTTAQNCLNAGLESGTLEGYQTYIGTINKEGIVTVNTLGFSPTQHKIMHVSDGIDSIAHLYCKTNNSLPVVPPEGGDYTLRLGNPETGAKAERVLLPLTVTPELTFFQLRYAVVLNDPDHNPFEQPRFELRILDKNGEQLACGEYKALAAANIPGFEICDDWRVRPWTTAGFELKSFLGQDIQIEILTTDCARGKHAGYAYFDATCEPLTIVLEGYCPENITATMRVTEGFTRYDWNTGDTTNSIVLNNPKSGEVYQVTVTSATGCTVLLTDTIPNIERVTPKFSPAPDLSFCRDTSYWFTPQGAYLGDIYSVSHNEIGERFLINTQQDSSYTFISEGLYGCISDTLAFQIKKEPLSINSIVDSVSCFGGQDGAIQVSVHSDFLPIQYQWEHGVDITTLEQLKEGNYAVTVSDQINCTSTASFDINNPILLQASLVPTKVISCAEGSDGQINIEVTGGTPPFSILWNTEKKDAWSLEQLSDGIYSVTLTDAKGCIAENSLPLHSPTPLVVDSLIDPVSCLGTSDGKITLSISGGTPPYQVYWEDNPRLLTQSRNNLLPGTYRAIVEDSQQCSKEKQYIINYASNNPCDVYIPTVFSPNADGLNDYFFVMGDAHRIVIERMQIFDRWGNLVFSNEGECKEINQASCGWTGVFLDEPVIAGVYIYYIILKVEGTNQSFPYKGEVAVIR